MWGGVLCVTVWVGWDVFVCLISFVVYLFVCLFFVIVVAFLLLLLLLKLVVVNFQLILFVLMMHCSNFQDSSCIKIFLNLNSYSGIQRSLSLSTLQSALSVLWLITCTYYQSNKIFMIKIRKNFSWHSHTACPFKDGSAC